MEIKITIPEDLVEDISIRAEKENLSIASLIEAVVVNYIEIQRARDKIKTLKRHNPLTPGEAFFNPINREPK